MSKLATFRILLESEDFRQRNPGFRDENCLNTEYIGFYTNVQSCCVSLFSNLGGRILKTLQNHKNAQNRERQNPPTLRI